MPAKTQRTAAVSALAALFTLTLFMPKPAYSAPQGSYPGVWSGLYPSSSSLANVVSGTGSSCQLCHANTFGGDNYNGYGWKVRELINGGASVSSAILLAQDFDSDMNPAGSTNLAEITASTQPGWVPGAHNTLFFGNGSTQSNQSPPPVAGALDPPLFSLYGCGTNPANSISALSGAPVAGTTFVLGLDNPLGTQSAPAMSVLAIALAPDANFPCGTPLAGWGMSGPFGELLLSLSAPNPIVLIFGDAWTTPGSPAAVTVPIPTDPGLLGMSLYFQGVLSSDVNTLTNGMEITIGF